MAEETHVPLMHLENGAIWDFSHKTLPLHTLTDHVSKSTEFNGRTACTLWIKEEIWEKQQVSSHKHLHIKQSIILNTEHVTALENQFVKH